MKARILILASTLGLFIATSISAQKIGYVNSTLLLEDLTLVKNADKELASLQQNFIAEGQAQIKALETEYQAYLQEVNAGNLSKVQMAEREAKLQESQNNFREFEQQVQAAVEIKREDLYRPILKRIDEVIYEVGKSEGYDYIMDSGMGHLMHAPAGDDLTDIVKGKLEAK